MRQKATAHKLVILKQAVIRIGTVTSSSLLLTQNIEKAYAISMVQDPCTSRPHAVLLKSVWIPAQTFSASFYGRKTLSSYFLSFLPPLTFSLFLCCCCKCCGSLNSLRCGLATARPCGFTRDRGWTIRDDCGDTVRDFNPWTPQVCFSQCPFFPQVFQFR